MKDRAPLAFWPSHRSAAHGQVFDRPAKAAHLMPLEVRHHEHSICFGYYSGDFDRIEVLAFNLDPAGERAAQAIGDNQGRVYRGI